MTKGELLPCPFCGESAAELNALDMDYATYGVSCSCGASLAVAGSPVDATDAWNRREAATALSEQATRIEELEVQLAQRDDLLIKATSFRFADDLFVESKGPSAWGVTDGTYAVRGGTRMSFAEAVTFAREIAARRNRTTEKKDG